MKNTENLIKMLKKGYQYYIDNKNYIVLVGYDGEFYSRTYTYLTNLSHQEEEEEEEIIKLINFYGVNNWNIETFNNHLVNNFQHINYNMDYNYMYEDASYFDFDFDFD